MQSPSGTQRHNAHEAHDLHGDLGSTRENPVPRFRGPLPTISIDVDFEGDTDERPSLPEPRGSDYPSASRSRIWTSED